MVAMEPPFRRGPNSGESCYETVNLPSDSIEQYCQDVCITDLFTDLCDEPSAGIDNIWCRTVKIQLVPQAIRSVDTTGAIGTVVDDANINIAV